MGRLRSRTKRAYGAARLARIVHTEELEEGLLADYDANESIVGIEILDASEKVEHPDAIHYAVLKEAETVAA
jgi:uncharacterized protein YuzE